MIASAQRALLLTGLLLLLTACSVTPSTREPETQRPPETDTSAETQQPEPPTEPTPVEPVTPVELPEPVAPPPVEKVCPPQAKPVCPKVPASTTTLPVIGAVEQISIDPPGMQLNARIDTGATTSSLDARDIAEFERDGKPWVRFTLIDRESGARHELKRPVTRHVRIKGTDGQRRPVIKLKTRIGTIEQFTEFTISDRASFIYPALLGRNFLRDQAVVDVSRRYTVKTAAQR